MLPAALYNRPRWRHLACPRRARRRLLPLRLHRRNLLRRPPPHAGRSSTTHETLSLLGLLLAIAFLRTRHPVQDRRLRHLPASRSASCSRSSPRSAPGHETLAYPLGYSVPVWIILHVTLLLAAYAALLISLLASRALPGAGRPPQVKAHAPRGRGTLPPLETLDQIALKSLLFGLPCMTAGLLIGSVVALQTTGPTFFADPKVLLSLAMWVAYMR